MRTSNVSAKVRWAALLPAMVLPLAAAYCYFDLFSEYTFARWLYGGTKVFTLVWPLAAVVWLWRESWPRLELRASRHWRALPMGAMSGGLIVLLMLGVWHSPLGDGVRDGAADIRRKTSELGVLDHYWLFGIFIAAIHSLIEEYYWRWFVFGFLRKVISAPAAHGLAGLAFAAHHVVITSQYFSPGLAWFFGGMVGVGGIIWSKLYEKQGTLAGAWMSHALADLGILCVGHKLIYGTWM